MDRDGRAHHRSARRACAGSELLGRVPRGQGHAHRARAAGSAARWQVADVSRARGRDRFSRDGVRDPGESRAAQPCHHGVPAGARRARTRIARRPPDERARDRAPFVLAAVQLAAHSRPGPHRGRPDHRVEPRRRQAAGRRRCGGAAGPSHGGLDARRSPGPARGGAAGRGHTAPGAAPHRGVRRRAAPGCARRDRERRSHATVAQAPVPGAGRVARVAAAAAAAAGGSALPARRVGLGGGPRAEQSAGRDRGVRGGPRARSHPERCAGERGGDPQRSDARGPHRPDAARLRAPAAAGEDRRGSGRDRGPRAGVAAQRLQEGAHPSQRVSTEGCPRRGGRPTGAAAGALECGRERAPGDRGRRPPGADRHHRSGHGQARRRDRGRHRTRRAPRNPGSRVRALLHHQGRTGHGAWPGDQLRAGPRHGWADVDAERGGRRGPAFFRAAR